MTTDEFMKALTARMDREDKKAEEILDIMIGKKPRPGNEGIEPATDSAFVRASTMGSNNKKLLKFS